MRAGQELNDVTLISATSVNIESAASALFISSKFCKFGAIKLLSPIKPSSLHSSIEHILIQPMNLYGYSKFMVEELFKFVDTKFCLVIQADGFVINPNMWTNKFLEYDYIGAPWQSYVESNKGRIHFDKNRVGNGGFSLRSKKLLDICSHMKFDSLNTKLWPEDVLICHELYEEICNSGARFAPLDLASKFSIEAEILELNNSLGTSFGFHGKHWLANEYLSNIAKSSSCPEEFLNLLPKNSNGILLKNHARTGRLQPCPCGSTMRFKDCHGKIL